MTSSLSVIAIAIYAFTVAGSAMSINFTMVTVMPLAAKNTTNAVNNLTLALLTPLTGKLGFEENAAAATMALRQAQADGYLPGVTVK